MTSKPMVSPSILPVSFWPIPADDVCGPRDFDVPEVQVAFSGTGRRWLDIGGTRREMATRPNMMEVYGAGYEIKHTRWIGRQGHCAAIQFPRELSERLLGCGSAWLDFKSRHEVFDYQVVGLCKELANETRKGLPNGQLFAEGISLALAALLVKRYGLGAEELYEGKGGQFTAVQRERVSEFIEANLSGALNVSLLSSLVDLNASQFSRRFKMTFGLTPHRYILSRRIEVASFQLKTNPDQSIANLAFALGFSSQAHFTQAFRHQTGQTPGSFRR